MKVRPLIVFALVMFAALVSTRGGDWTQFRGPGGLGISDEKDLPVKWSSTENVVWKVALPGPGASCPVVAKERVYLTCYTGYGLEPNKGEQQQLLRHLLCFDRKSSKPVWSKEFKPKLPEHGYQGEGSYHGYAASTPLVDGDRLYVFFGKSGVFCLDLEGNEIWQASVGDNTNGWGSGTSPIVFGDLLIVNASIESGSLVGLNKLTGKEVWRAKGINSAWNTPVLVSHPERPEVIVSTDGRLRSFNPRDGQPLWDADGVHRYVCPSVVVHDNVVYAIGGGHTSLAVKTGGSGDVTATHTLWKKNLGSNVGSPVYHEGHLYWGADGGGVIVCQDAQTGETVYKQRLEPESGTIWSSAVLGAGKLYLVSQHKGTFVVAAKPTFEQLAHNLFQEDDSRTNASPAVSNGQLFLRTDRMLYCIGRK